ncbi:ATP-dependent rna helicase eif4a [Fusarium longipes]|uniref:RNA helicase n=1 Tax=Fusarium longipes TaxID=694270 RepID=A0A395T5W1_9HYPO|nr:ATP-dependent rna helicase eif4a [Fusarium longipes]
MDTVKKARKKALNKSAATIIQQLERTGNIITAASKVFKTIRQHADQHCCSVHSPEMMDGGSLENIETTQIESNVDQITESFDAMALESNLLRGVYAYGFENPSAIQRRAIKPMIEGHNIIAQAQSKTGKTVALCISVLQRVDPSVKACQALVLAPSRVMAQEMHKVMDAIGDFMDIHTHVCKGPREDIEVLKDGPQVVLGTPGRLQNMIQRGILRIDNTKMFVLDDADEVLARGFEEQIEDIFSLLPQSAQVIFVSATMPGDVLAIGAKFMRDFVRIIVKSEPLIEGVKQFYIAAENEDSKLDILSHIYESMTSFQTIVFCSTRRKLEWLADKLTARGLAVSSMHGDMDAVHRCKIMEEFRSGSSRILMATDLLARGIDVQQVLLIVNIDLPSQPEKYMYRVGWGGRPSRKGVAINLATAHDMFMMREIEQYYGTHIEMMPENESLETIISKLN